MCLGLDIICLPYPAMVYSKLLSLAHGTARSFSLSLHSCSCSLKISQSQTISKSFSVLWIKSRNTPWGGLLSLRLSPCALSTLWPFQLRSSLDPFITRAFYILPSIHNLDYNFSNQIPRSTFLVGPVQASLEFWGRGHPPALARQLEERGVPAPGPPSPVYSQH